MIFFLLKRKIFHWLYKLFSVYKITLLSTQRRLVHLESGRVLCWSIYIIIIFFFLSILLVYDPLSPSPNRGGEGGGGVW